MEVTNVTPNELKMMFNVRNTTLTTQKEVKLFVQKHLKGLDYELQLTQGSYPFRTNIEAKVVQSIDRAIKKVTGIEPKHSTAGGTSDARFVASFGIDVIEFGVKNDTIHAVNERTTAGEVYALYKVFKMMIEDWR